MLQLLAGGLPAQRAGDALENLDASINRDHQTLQLPHVCGMNIARNYLARCLWKLALAQNSREVAAAEDPS